MRMREEKINVPALFTYQNMQEYQIFLDTLTDGQRLNVEKWRTPPSYFLHIAEGSMLKEKDLYCMKIAAADPSLEPDTLSTLYDYGLLFPNPEVVLQVLAHPRVDSGILTKASLTWRDRVWVTVPGYAEMVTVFALANPNFIHVEESLHTLLGSLPRTSVGNSRGYNRGKADSGRATLLFRRHWPAEENVMLKMLTDPCIRVGEKILEELYLWGLGEHEAGSGGEKDFPYSFENIELVERILVHPNCPISLKSSFLHLWKMIEQADAYVHSYEQEFVKDVLLEVLNDPDCSAVFIEEACWVQDQDMRRVIASHPNCSDEVKVVVALREDM